MTPLVLFAGLGAGGLRAPWAWTLFALVSWSLASSRPPRARLPGAAAWAALLGWTALSAALSAEPLRAAAAFAYAATAWLWLWLGASFSGEEDRRWAAAALGAFAVVAGLAAVLIDVPSFRAVGLFFPYYNYTAAVVAAAGAAAAASPRTSGLLVPAALYLAWAGSRGGLLALAAGTALALWRRGRRGPLAGAAAVLALFLLVPSGARDGLLKLGRPGSHARPALWRAALSVAAERPFLGEGPGGFARGFLRHQVPAPPGLRRTRFALAAERAHSGPLDVAAETGFVGLCLLAAGLWAVWRRRPAAGDVSREALLAAAAALTAQACVDSILALPALAWLTAWCLGAACASERPQAPVLPEAPRKALAAGGLALACLAWWPAWAASRLPPAGALRVYPADAGLWSALARARLRADDPSGALQALGRAEELRPFDASLPVMAAELLRASGEWERVLVLSSRALELEPDAGQARLLRAEALARLGRREEARAELEALRSSAAAPIDELDPARDPEAFILGYDPARYWKAVSVVE